MSPTLDHLANEMAKALTKHHQVLDRLGRRDLDPSERSKLERQAVQLGRAHSAARRSYDMAALVQRKMFKGAAE